MEDTPALAGWSTKCRHLVEVQRRGFRMSIGAQELRPDRGATHSKKRIGRGNGSGTGTYAGKGLKGQKSRSGKNLPYDSFEGGQFPSSRSSTACAASTTSGAWSTSPSTSPCSTASRPAPRSRRKRSSRGHPQAPAPAREGARRRRTQQGAQHLRPPLQRKREEQDRSCRRTATLIGADAEAAEEN